MAKFRCEIIKISEMKPHPNADRMELAFISGWQSCVPIGKFKTGDRAVYITVDSILSQDVENILFPPGSKITLKNSRVRSIKLRGAMSQGMLEMPETLGLPPNIKEGTDVAKKLGITKYQPPVVRTPGMMKAKPKKHKNLNFKVYTNIGHFKYYPKCLENMKIWGTEKIHGCFQARTKIDLADGTKKSISDIVKNKLDVEVLGMNDKDQIVPTKILNWFDNGKTNNWMNIKFERNGTGGNFYGSIFSTPNQEFYYPIGKKYINANKLNIGDEILVKRSTLHLSYIHREILIGKMLGDGCLSANSIHFNHKKDHEHYIDYTLKCLGNISGNKGKDTVSGYGSIMCRGRSISNYKIGELFENWFVDGKKQIPDNIYLSPISIAFWYMDDGSLTHEDNQEDRVGFATCGFNEKSIDNLLNALKKLNINADKFKSDDNKYWRIRLKSDEADKLFVMILPYIYDEMQYKLPERYRGQKNIELDSFSEYKPDSKLQIILSIEKIILKKRSNHTRFDLETETHNFFANGVLVHNSNFRSGWVKYNAFNWWRKIGRFLRIIPSHEFAYGSHRVELTRKGRRSTGFYKQNVYHIISEQYRLRQVLAPGEVVYGEIYGQGIQKGYDYGCKEKEWRMIVVDIMIDGKYLDGCKAREFCNMKGLPYAPVLIDNELFDYNAIEKIANPKGDKSTLYPDLKRPMEGIVIKPMTETKGHMGRMTFKWINDNYWLNKGNTDWH